MWLGQQGWRGIEQSLGPLKAWGGFEGRRAWGAQVG